MSLAFDAETRELIGLDAIKEILDEIDKIAEMDIEELEQQAKAVKDGDATMKTVENSDDDGDTDSEGQPSASH